MPLQALAVPLPLTQQTIDSHPALRFFSLYAQKFPQTHEHWATSKYDDFYAADCRTIKTDGSVIEGGEASWEEFRRLHSSFLAPERELKSLVVVTDEEKGTHAIHSEFLTKLAVDGGREVVLLPQSFVHVVGQADEGKGFLGLQVRELRNYYDAGIWQAAAKRK